VANFYIVASSFSSSFAFLLSVPVHLIVENECFLYYFCVYFVTLCRICVPFLRQNHICCDGMITAHNHQVNDGHVLHYCRHGLIIADGRQRPHWLHEGSTWCHEDILPVENHSGEENKGGRRWSETQTSRKLPPWGTWEVHCLPGAKLQQINSVIKDLLLNCSAQTDNYLCASRDQPPWSTPGRHVKQLMMHINHLFYSRLPISYGAPHP